MNKEVPQKIIERWNEEFDKNFFNNLFPELKRLRQRTKNETPMIIWIGGPGSNHELFHLRKLIRDFLKSNGFNTIFSEDFPEGADIASKEIEESAASDVVFVLSMSPGSSAESIEFAYVDIIHNKLFIYIPSEYRNGYVYKSLSGKHRLVSEHDLFSLKDFIQYNSELPHKVLNRALSCRFDKFRKKNMCLIIS